MKRALFLAWKRKQSFFHFHFNSLKISEHVLLNYVERKYNAFLSSSSQKDEI